MNKSKILKLESKNFRVNSDDWIKKTKNYLKILESPTKDIWEINEGELRGEQLFTWDSAIRETKKANKRIPTDEEWGKLVDTKEDIENLLFAGHCYTNGCFCSQGSDTNFWSSSESSTDAWMRYLFSSYSIVGRHTFDKALGFSVRCIQD